MATLSLPQLSLNLPSSRMSVNFDTFTTDFNTAPIRKPRVTNMERITRKPLPTTYKQPRRLNVVTEEYKPSHQTLSRHDSGVGSDSGIERRGPDQLFQTIQNAYVVSRTASPASTSSASSQVDSVFSRAASTSTTRSSSTTSLQSKDLHTSFRKKPLNISDLPHSLLEHILSYVLPVTRTVSIGSVSMEHRHMQYRYHRPSFEYLDLRQALKHPLFSVSHHIRAVSIDFFYQKCTFAIDLACIYYTRVASTVDENIKKQLKFWADDPPKIVEDSLQKIAKLHIRLPVPSTEAGVRRGREEDEWMDGSDGKGGGNWRLNSAKKEQEDAQSVQKCLDAIVQLLAKSPSESPQRKRSFVRRNRSQSRGRSSTRSNEAGDGKRTLKRLEVVLVKRSSRVSIQKEVLGLVKALGALQVTGLTQYCFELKGQNVTWATKYRGKWRGMEPDGVRLLQDLQDLTVAEKPLEPICTPVEYKFVNVDKGGRIGFLDSVRPKTPIVLEAPKLDSSHNRDMPPVPSQVPATSKSVLRNPLAIFGKKSHKRSDSYEMTMEDREPSSGGLFGGKSLGKSHSKGNQRPTIEELQKIADDIRNGLY